MRRFSKEFIKWVLWIMIGVGVALFLNACVLVNAHVLTGSMEGTIMTRNRVFGLRTSYLFSQPRRGDIIVFESPLPDEFTEPFIKRIIGLPGEEIKIFGGIVHINGVPLAESYVLEEMRQDFGPVEVPAGSVFVMGDNRNHSRDSREWGAICKNTIIGRIYIDFSPMPTIVVGYQYYWGLDYEGD